MTHRTSRLAGLAIFGLLSLGDVATVALTDGEHPPYAIAAPIALLGIVCLVLVVRAFRQPDRSVRLLVGLRLLSAATTLPAFLMPDVPAAAVAAAATVVLMTAAGVVLTARTLPVVMAS